MITYILDWLTTDYYTPVWNVMTADYYTPVWNASSSWINSMVFDKTIIWDKPLPNANCARPGWGWNGRLLWNAESGQFVKIYENLELMRLEKAFADGTYTYEDLYTVYRPIISSYTLPFCAFVCVEYWLGIQGFSYVIINTPGLIYAFGLLCLI